MEVKPGYKQTEVGVIPEDWEIVPFSNVVKIRGEKFNPKKDGVSNFCIELEHISQGKGTIVGFSVTHENSSLKNEFKQKDILFGKLRSYLRKYWIADREGVCSSEIWAFVAINHVSVPEYVFQMIQTDAFIECSSIAYGTHMPRADWNIVKMFMVPLPPFPEQTAIATALSDVDALISGLDRLIEKKRAIKQAAMQELLTGKRRLPGFDSGKGYKQTEVGEIPEDWDVCKLGDCLKCKPEYGINAPAISYSFNYPKYIRITDITDNGEYSNEGVVSVQQNNSMNFVLEEGDLVFARTGASVGKSYLYNPKDGLLVFAGFLIRIKPNPNKLNPVFLFNYVKTSQFWTWVRIMSMRSGQPGINGTEYTQLPLTLPKINEQTAIATVLSDMDAEISSLETRKAKTISLKQGMMQELLTGRIRLV